MIEIWEVEVRVGDSKIEIVQDVTSSIEEWVAISLTTTGMVHQDLKEEVIVNERVCLIFDLSSHTVQKKMIKF